MREASLSHSSLRRARHSEYYSRERGEEELEIGGPQYPHEEGRK